MKFVVFFGLLASAAAIDITILNDAGPFEAEDPGFRSGSDGDGVKVITDERDGPVGPNYSFLYELNNGVRFEESGRAGENGEIIKAGSYSFITNDGLPVVTAYIADENGYRPEGNIFPGISSHIHELLKIAEQQRADGIQFNEQGFRI